MAAKFGAMLSVLKDKRTEKQEKLASTPEGTLSACPCGRTENEHLQDDITCLTAMVMVLETGDLSLWVEP